MVKRESLCVFFSFDRIYTFSIAHSAPTLRNKQNMAQNPPPTKHHRRVVDYCSDEEEEDEEFVIEEELNKLSALIETSLANAFGFACCDELAVDENLETKRLSAHLRLILTPLSSSKKEEMKNACEECLTTLWRVLRDESCGWDKPTYRECFVLSSLRLSLCTLLEGNLQEAMECLDTALILGCPGEMARPFVRVLEKLLRRSAGGGNRASSNSLVKKQKVAAREKALVVDNVLPSSSSLVPKILHPLERMNDNATWEEFKVMYFNKDMPVQLPSDKSMPCVEKWRDLAYFKERFGKRLIPLEVGKYDDVENWKEEIVPLEVFIDEHLAPDILKKGDKNSFVSYLAQHQLFEQIPQLAMDFEIPTWCNAGTI